MREIIINVPFPVLDRGETAKCAEEENSQTHTHAPNKRENHVHTVNHTLWGAIGNRTDDAAHRKWRINATRWHNKLLFTSADGKKRKEASGQGLELTRCRTH